MHPKSKRHTHYLFPGYQIQQELEEREIGQKALPLPTDLSFDNPLKVAKTIETLVEHLGRHRGITGVPLSYVVRDNKSNSMLAPSSFAVILTKSMPALTRLQNTSLPS